MGLGRGGGRRAPSDGPTEPEASASAAAEQEAAASREAEGLATAYGAEAGERTVGDILAERPSSSGEASGGEIRLRENASLEAGSEDAPLVVLDGERIETESVLGDLDPEQIESIEVLTGPAALDSYGEAGRNGVIRVTTKAAAGSGG